jgi:ribosomal-protein-alanine N-acetyltransferase
MTTTLLAPPDVRPPHPASTVDVQPLRPIHAIDLAAVDLALDGLRAGHDLTRHVRTRRWVMRQVARRSADTRAYVVTRDGAAVGVVLLENIRRADTFAAELQVYVDRAHRREDVAGAAVRRVVDVARELGLHRLEAAVLPDDAAARGLLTGGGFVPVGLARGYRLVDGQWRDHVLYERLVAEGG